MDLSTFIAYLFILANLVLLSWRISWIAADIRHLGEGLHYLAFIETARILGHSDEEINERLKRMGQQAEEAMAFAEITEQIKRPLWKRLLGR